jgi:nitroreductase/formate hydrogenlyase subunit 6/NADH:ubiquinone oxidoreductase subunit I
MAIPTTRAKEAGRISIDETLCTGCGLCAEVCKDYGISIKDGKACISENPIFGCIGCGHCMAICPHDAISISGRCISREDLFNLPHEKNPVPYPELMDMLNKRRSIREFIDLPVEKELLEKILTAAQTAPMGLPPSDVHVLVLDSKEKVRTFAEDFCRLLEGMKWFVSDWFLTFMRPFWGKSNDEMFRGFIRPCLNLFTESMKKGVNLVNYDAPVAIYFYGSPYGDPADPIIAATYAMLAAESLGLGTCMLGAIHPFIQYGKASKKFREKYNIRHKSREGLFLIIGYPKVEYKKGIRRNFAAIDW